MIEGCWGRLQSPLRSVRTGDPFPARDVRLRTLGDLTDFLFLHLSVGLHALRTWETMHRVLRRGLRLRGLPPSAASSVADAHYRLHVVPCPHLPRPAGLPDEPRLLFCAENATTRRSSAQILATSAQILTILF